MKAQLPKPKRGPPPATACSSFSGAVEDDDGSGNEVAWFWFFVNLGDGTAWRVDAARIVRFDGAHDGRDLKAVALEDTPPELVTYPTDVTVNSEGVLIVVSYDNAHAFVTLKLPHGGFLDNGLHDLNVNSGNYGTAVASETIRFTRANNKNGSLRAITSDLDHAPRPTSRSHRSDHRGWRGNRATTPAYDD